MNESYRQDLRLARLLVMTLDHVSQLPGYRGPLRDRPVPEAIALGLSFGKTGRDVLARILLRFVRAMEDRLNQGTDDDVASALSDVESALAPSRSSLVSLDELKEKFAERGQTWELDRTAAEQQAQLAAIASVVDHLRAENGINTDRALAERSGISETTVRAIREQRVQPHFRTLCKIADSFGLSYDMFMKLVSRELSEGGSGSDLNFKLPIYQAPRCESDRSPHRRDTGRN
jgi:transcriptional regulator with XRE-family HTH domain